MQISYDQLFIDENSTNRYISKDETESWFDYKINNVLYHCIRHSYHGNIDYLIAAWFDQLNYKNNWHICRFQTSSKSFIKAFNKIKKLCNQKDITFDGSYDYFENTSGYYWKIYKRL